MPLFEYQDDQCPVQGLSPCIVLIEPQYAHNVGAVQRAASCWGFTQVWFTGHEVSIHGGKGQRLPREERMYDDVDVIKYQRPFAQLSPDAVPVAVELRPHSQCLLEFEHPENAVYVFGPENGGLTRPVLQLCHRFVTIPTRHCLNLAAAVNVILYDRIQKIHRATGELPPNLGLVEHRGPVG